MTANKTLISQILFAQSFEALALLKPHNCETNSQQTAAYSETDKSENENRKVEGLRPGDCTAGRSAALFWCKNPYGLASGQSRSTVHVQGKPGGHDHSCSDVQART